jgi:hypothetical protein
MISVGAIGTMIDQTGEPATPIGFIVAFFTWPFLAILIAPSYIFTFLKGKSL